MKPLPLVPKTRGECVNGPRPCVATTCKYHLESDVPAAERPKRFIGSSYLRALENRRINGVTDTCALDVADRGPLNQAEVGRMLGITRQAVQQIEERALAKFGRAVLKARLKR